MTLADYASTSGVAICLEGDVWVNAPISDHNPNFVVAPPSVLDVRDGRFVVVSGKTEVAAELLPVPGYYDKRNESGELYIDYCHTHTDRARISPIEGCSQACKFCDLSYQYRYRLKDVSALVESVRVALSDRLLPARHVLISGGTPAGNDYEYLNNVYEAVLSEFSDIPVDIMMTPLPNLMDIERLNTLGVHQLSINIEMYNSGLAERYMPEKAAVGIDAYLGFIEKAVEILGPGRVRSLILVGLEDTSDTLAGVKALAERGCEPVLSPFRPSPKTPLRKLQPPGAELLSEVYQRSVDIVEKCGVKLGPKCIPCMHNTLTFPDDSGYYSFH
ncbi:MAG: radical SAM protein [Desulfobacteraceae bacterium]|nr:radical SAM protein [Desulfobacteraceae bacterium]